VAQRIHILTIHCKKRFLIFPSPAGILLAKLSLTGEKLNYSWPGRVWSVTWDGKTSNLFYSVAEEGKARFKKEKRMEGKGTCSYIEPCWLGMMRKNAKVGTFQQMSLRNHGRQSRKNCNTVIKYAFHLCGFRL
jgi:hypothetical protein